jgi:hypothetical protein
MQAEDSRGRRLPVGAGLDGAEEVFHEVGATSRASYPAQAPPDQSVPRSGFRAAPIAEPIRSSSAAVTRAIIAGVVSR